MADSQRDWNLEGFEDKDPNVHAPKMIYAGEYPTGQPYLVMNSTGISLVCDSNKVISLDQDQGLMLQGVLSMSALPEQIQFGGGYWTINPQVLSTLPSTTPTPIPWLVKKDAPRLLAAQSDVQDSISGIESFSDIAGF